MMKKVFMVICVFFCIFMCSGCMKQVVLEIEKKEDGAGTYNEIEIKKGQYPYKETFLEFNNYDFNCIESEEIAIEYGYLLLKSFGVLSEYVIYELFYDENEKYWIYSFGEPISDEERYKRLGGSITMIVSQKNGQVLYIMNEE